MNYNIQEKALEDKKDKIRQKLPHLSQIEAESFFEDDFDNRKSVRIIKLDKFYPEHKINYEDDYYRIQKFAIQDKERTLLLDWVKRQVGDAYVKIGNEYQSCSFPIDWEKKQKK